MKPLKIVVGKEQEKEAEVERMKKVITILAEENLALKKVLGNCRTC